MNGSHKPSQWPPARAIFLSPGGAKRFSTSASPRPVKHPPLGEPPMGCVFGSWKITSPFDSEETAAETKRATGPTRPIMARSFAPCTHGAPQPLQNPSSPFLNLQSGSPIVSPRSLAARRTQRRPHSPQRIFLAAKPHTIRCLPANHPEKSRRMAVRKGRQAVTPCARRKFCRQGPVVSPGQRISGEQSCRTKSWTM